MALNWNIEKIRDYKDLDENWAVTEALIWATMIVGLGEITEKNYKKFYIRLHEIEIYNGSYLNRNSNPAYISLADVERHIGLHTNAGNKSDADWRRQQNRIAKNK